MIITKTKEVTFPDGETLTVSTEMDTVTGAMTTYINDKKGATVIYPKSPDAAIASINKSLSASDPEGAAMIVDAISEQVSMLKAETPQPSEPVPTALQNVPSTNTLTGTSDDDSKAGEPTTSPGSLNDSNISNSASASDSANSATSSDIAQPNTYFIGKRTYNPLSKYSSYTYQLSLYMITPDALGEFNRNGRKNIFALNGTREAFGMRAGAYLIAQSGGIKDPTSRAPGFEFDYFIDNLKIESSVSSKATSSPTINTQYNFTITEQYGFKFITNLKRAKEALEAYSATVNYQASKNASRQFFILGIKFLGYDADGNLITESMVHGNDSTFERFYDINITDISFKLDGKSTVYNITAVSLPVSSALGQKRGVIDKGAPQLVGSTVGDILDELMKKMTKDQADDANAKKREFGNSYKITYIGEASVIKNSSIVSSADVSKIKWSMGAPSDKTQVNTSLEIKAQPNNTERVMSFNRDTPVIQAITSVISQSKYIVDGLTSVYTTDEQPDAKTNSQTSQKIDSNKRLKWFTVTPVIDHSQTKFDDIVKDWVFSIDYQVRTYEIPILKSAYADSTSPYYGPVKRYDYIWTGKNSEILRYEQNMNNAYFTVSLDGATGSTAATGGNAQVPIVVGKVQPADRLGKLGVGKEAQNSVVTDLISPGDWVDAKIEILGDPDWLANDTGVTDLTSNEKSFYGPDGNSIRFNEGQVFIEIKFLEAVDYEHDSGTLNINENILFWDYPVSVAKKLDGAISYRVNKIDHYFRAGKFTQELICSINTFSEVKGEKTVKQERAETQAAVAETDREVSNLASRYPPPAGLKTEPAISSGTAGSGIKSVVSESENTKKGVADDDSTHASTGSVGNEGRE